MVRNVSALPMGPFRSSHRHGPPVLGRVQGQPLFPDVIARMQPSDSLPPSATTPVPLAMASLVADASSLPHEADDTCVRQRVVRRRRVIGSPQHRWFLRGEVRASQVTGPSSSYVLWSNTPPDTAPSSPNTRRGPLLPSLYSSTLGIRKEIGFGAAVPRPARSPAYAMGCADT